MTKRRSYRDQCGIARALDTMGDRWALLIVRELMLGPKRFSELRAGLPRIGPDVLSQRLRELEGADIVRQNELAAETAVNVYELTDRGRALEPVLLALGRWGSAQPMPAQTAAFSPDSAILALKTMFGPTRADVLDGRLALTLAGVPFTVTIRDGELDVARGEARAPDAALDTDPGPLAAIVWHGLDLDAAIGAGLVRFGGSRPDAERMLAAFRNGNGE
jgi:DNA-binding HxlR family transcriptional regulator